jgi:hypothetical protein
MIKEAFHHRFEFLNVRVVSRLVRGWSVCKVWGGEMGSIFVVGLCKLCSPYSWQGDCPRKGHS